MEQLKVSTRSNPNSVAGAMAGVVRAHGAVEVQVVGAGALNQAIKAVAIACGYVAGSGIELVCIPEFADITIDGERRTAIRLRIEDRSRAGRAGEATDVAAGSNVPADAVSTSPTFAVPDTAGAVTVARAPVRIGSTMFVPNVHVA